MTGVQKSQRRIEYAVASIPYMVGTEREAERKARVSKTKAALKDSGWTFPKHQYYEGDQVGRDTAFVRANSDVAVCKEKYGVDLVVEIISHL